MFEVCSLSLAMQKWLYNSFTTLLPLKVLFKNKKKVFRREQEVDYHGKPNNGARKQEIALLTGCHGSRGSGRR